MALMLPTEIVTLKKSRNNEAASRRMYPAA
jgi:hypothetical protein